MSPATRTSTCLVAAFAALTFAACGAPSSAPGAAAKPADLTTPTHKSGTLTVVTKFADPKYAPYFVGVAKAYEAANAAIMDYLPGVPLAHPVPSLAFKDDVKNYPASPVQDEVFNVITLGS